MSDKQLVGGESNELEVIEFYLDEEMADGSKYTSYYGMNVVKVLEIIRLPKVITGVPGNHHPAALGTFNLRGRVMPLVDLGVWLNKQVVPSETRKVLVSDFSGIVTAFVVSGVNSIHRMTWAQVEPPGKYLQAFSHDCVNGVIRFDSRILFLLDMEQIIASMNPALSMESMANKITADDGINGHGHRILLADDSAAIRKTIASTLSIAGYEIIQTACGREAWEKLQSWRAQAVAEDKPISEFVDLVISDIEMPEMDGHSLTRRIKADPLFSKVPVLLFSSLISDVVKQRGVKAGADDQISKPELPELATRVKHWIDKMRSSE